MSWMSVLRYLQSGPPCWSTVGELSWKAAPGPSLAKASRAGLRAQRLNAPAISDCPHAASPGTADRYGREQCRLHVVAESTRGCLAVRSFRRPDPQPTPWPVLNVARRSGAGRPTPFSRHVSGRLPLQAGRPNYTRHRPPAIPPMWEARRGGESGEKKSRHAAENAAVSQPPKAGRLPNQGADYGQGPQSHDGPAALAWFSPLPGSWVPAPANACDRPVVANSCSTS